MQELFKEIIKTEVKPFFAKHGYAKKDLNFSKSAPNLVYSFNIQKYKANTWNHVMFYVNCAIHSRELAQFQAASSAVAAESVSTSLTAASHFAARIEEIIPSAPSRYSLTPDVDKDPFTAELLVHLETAVAFLEAITDARAIIDYYRPRVALHLSEETLRYLLHHGDKETADQYVQQLHAKYGAEKRWAIWDRKYSAVYAMHD